MAKNRARRRGQPLLHDNVPLSAVPGRGLISRQDVFHYRSEHGLEALAKLLFDYPFRRSRPQNNQRGRISAYADNLRV